MTAPQKLILLICVLFVFTGCTPTDDKKETLATEEATNKSTQETKVEPSEAMSNEKIKDLQRQIEKLEEWNEQLYWLRNEIDMMAYTLFTAIKYNELDRLDGYVSKQTTIENNHVKTTLEDGTTYTFDFSWYVNSDREIESIRQRAYTLLDDDMYYESIYEFRYRPDDTGEFFIGVVVVKFVLEDEQWKVYQVIGDI